MLKRIIAMVILIFITVTATGCINIFVPKIDKEVAKISILVTTTGQGEVTGAGEYEKGATVTLVATPSEGYEFTGYFKGETLVSQNATYTFSATISTSYRVVFTIVDTRPVYTVAVASVQGGATSGAGEYREGETVTLVASPTELYDFLYWKSGNQTLSTSLEYSFEITENMTIEPVFLKVRYTVTILSSSNGRIAPLAKTMFLLNEDVTLLAIANNSYIIYAWEINGIMYYSNETNITITITQDMVVKAFFRSELLEPFNA